MKTALTFAALFAIVTSAAHAETFYTIEGVTSDTSGTDLFPASRLIEGTGVGFDASEPHNRLSALTWVTNAPNGGAGDYFAPTPTPAPRLVFDLGQNQRLNEISVWGYADGNANGVRTFDLRFATEADGTGGFGTSIAFNPTLVAAQPVTPRQSIDFGTTVHARYVELTPTDNFFGISPPGGDRVGLGEVAFAVVPTPEPSTLILAALSVAGLSVVRRRRNR